ncbi:MAG: ParB/RepB/Spo0J family partition protein [Lachnospiraceae bacterium]
MAKKFTLADMWGEAGLEQAEKTSKSIMDVQMVSIFDMHPHPINKDYYKNTAIEQLENSIYADGRVRQNLEVVPAVGENFKYWIISGHRRHRACTNLYEEGYIEFEFVPAVVLPEMSDDEIRAAIIMTNSTQREMTDWEKVMQHMAFKKILPGLKKRKGLDGKVREIESDFLNVSQTQIAIYNTIGTRLNPACMKKFENGEIGISLAYEIAKADGRVQKTIENEMEIRPEHVTEEFIKNLINKQPMKGQMELKSEQVPVPEKVSESDTSVKDEPVQIPEPEKVSESDTFREETEPEHIPKHGKAESGILLGGYDERTIDTQYAINKSYYEGALKEHKYGMAYKYACICDGLVLLKAHLNKIE